MKPQPRFDDQQETDMALELVRACLEGRHALVVCATRDQAGRVYRLARELLTEELGGRIAVAPELEAVPA